MSAIILVAWLTVINEIIINGKTIAKIVTNKVMAAAVFLLLSLFASHSYTGVNKKATIIAAMIKEKKLRKKKNPATSAIITA